jgi:L-ornithine N5-monooxygenase
MTAAGQRGGVLDVLGVGFGPSNLALAIALAERDTRAAGPRPVRAEFLERQRQFGWHRGMLITGATMQVSFLKDLVTMRNPTSEFSFLAYLHQRGRLATFINQKDFYPTRVEFHDYLSWAAGRLRHSVTYGLEVVDATPVIADGDVQYADVTARRVSDGRQVTYRARNIVVATGLEPYLPPEAPVSRNVLHSEMLLHKLSDVPDGKPYTFVVVGAGQSAAEAAEYLHSRFPQATIYSVFARYGYSPADDTPFVNAIFDPATVDLFFNAPSEVKDLLLDYHSNTNYSVVDTALITELHQRVYRELVVGERRLIMRNLSRVVAARATGAGLDVDIKYLPDGSVTPVHADWLIYATGYRPRSPLGVLGKLSSYCKIEPNQSVRLDRDHRIVTSERMRCGIYVQGAAEATHGISSTLLSTTAIRAGEIAEAIAAGLRGDGCAGQSGAGQSGAGQSGTGESGVHDD